MARIVASEREREANYHTLATNNNELLLFIKIGESWCCKSCAKLSIFKQETFYFQLSGMKLFRSVLSLSVYEGDKTIAMRMEKSFTYTYTLWYRC